MSADTTPTARGLTVDDVALRYRVSPTKVRTWIRAGHLRAINTSSIGCSRPRFVVPPDALAEFEQMKAAAEPPKAPRRQRRSVLVDLFAE